MNDKISIADKFSKFSEYWTPKIIAQGNGQLVKLAKGNGELIWHSHAEQDEIFIVFKGELTLKMRDRTVVLNAGDLYVVAAGVEHCPVATTDTEIMIIEPTATAHTGQHVTEVTVAVEQQQWI